MPGSTWQPNSSSTLMAAHRKGPQSVVKQHRQGQLSALFESDADAIIKFDPIDVKSYPL